MNPADITVDQAVAALEKAVQIKGTDYVYLDSMCTYVDENGNPACIVGHAFAELGILDRVIDNGSVYEVNSDYDLGLPVDVLSILAAAQDAQDGSSPFDYLAYNHRPRKTWGEALDLARRVAKDLGRTS